MFFNNKTKNGWILIVVLFFISNIPMFISQGIYWDDWTLYNMGYSNLMSQFEGNGAVFAGELHYFVIKYFGAPFIHRNIVLIAQLLSFYFIYSSFKIIGLEKYKWISFFSLLLPFFSAKNTMICSFLPVYSMLYYGALYLLIYYLLISRKFYIRLIVLFLFYISFYLNSLLVFYLFPLCIIWFVHNKKEIKIISFQKVKTFIIKNVDFIILPVLFFVLQKIFTVKKGGYKDQGYNELNFNGLFSLPGNIIESFDASFFGLFRELFNFELFYRYNLIFVIIFMIILYGSGITFSKVSSLKKFACIGLFLFFLGVIPYCVVGKPPRFSGYETRHQLLLPLGASLLLISLLSFFIKEKLLRHVYIFLLSLFVLIGFKINMKFVDSWLKQESLSYHIAENSTIFDDNKTVFYEDLCKDLNESSRDYTFYVLNGIVKKTLDKEDVLLISKGDFNIKKRNIHLFAETPGMYNMGNYDFSLKPTVNMEVSKGNYILGPRKYIEIIYCYYFNQKKFQSKIGKLLNVNFQEF